MTPDAIAMAAMIILLFPMGYFTLATPAFLLVKLDIEPVAVLLRGMFNVHFRAMSVAGVIGTVALLVAGRPLVAAGVGLIAASATFGRRRFMRLMDDQLSARDAGDPDAPRQLRRLHLSGMVCNAVLLGVLVASIPYAATST